MEVEVMASLARTASIAGLVVLVSILTVEVIAPSLIAGAPPPSGTLDRDRIAAWYDHRALELFLGLGQQSKARVCQTQGEM